MNQYDPKLCAELQALREKALSADASPYERYMNARAYEASVLTVHAQLTALQEVARKQREALVEIRADGINDSHARYLSAQALALTPEGI